MDKQDEILGFKVEQRRVKLISMLGNSKRMEFNAIFAGEFKKKDDKVVLREKNKFGGSYGYIKHDKFYKGQTYTLLKCLSNNKGEKIAEHLWVLFSKKMKNLDLKIGDKIKFYAKVYKYNKNIKMCDQLKLVEHWSLRSIIDIEKIGNIL